MTFADFSAFAGQLLSFSNLFALMLMGTSYAILFYKKQTRIIGRRILMGIMYFTALLTFFPIGNWVIAKWEERVPFVLSEELPEEIDGIVVLGGAVHATKWPELGGLSAGAASERLIALLALGAKYPDAPVAYAAGEKWESDVRPAESDVVYDFVLGQKWAKDLSERMILEEQSKTTYENIFFAYEILAQQELLADPDEYGRVMGQKWLLVTSAYHMPRAIAVADRLGWEMLPMPVDFRAEPRDSIFCVCFGQNLRNLELVLHEAIGMFVYHGTGRI